MYWAANQLFKMIVIGLQNTCKRKTNLRGLKRHEGEQMTAFKLLGELFLSFIIINDT